MVGWLMVGWLVAGCGDGQSVTSTKQALPEGVVARVGSLDIAVTTVAAIAERQQVSLEQARERAIYDALMAGGARADLAPQVVAAAEDRVLARALLRGLWAQAQQTPISEAELAEAIERRWTELDRPVGYRTVHAVVHSDVAADEAHHRRAKALAEQIRKAVGPPTSAARLEPIPERSESAQFRRGAGPADPLATAFLTAAKQVGTDGLKVDAQLLPPITAKGYPIERDNIRTSASYDPAFTAAAAGMTSRGELGEVVKSAFGYHVILLLEITPAKHVSRRECLELLEDGLLSQRGRQARAELVERLQQSQQAAIVTNADALMTHVRIVEMPEDLEAGEP